MATLSEQLKELENQRLEIEKKRDALVAAEMKKSLARAQQAINEVNSLGFNYEIVERKGRGKATARGGTRTLKDEPCPVCHFKTDPPHDRRRHGKHATAQNRPFTDQELSGMGLTKV